MKAQNGQAAIKINNNFFYVDGSPSSAFKLIGTIGFSIYCHLLIKQSLNNKVTVSLKDIIHDTKCGTKATTEQYIKILHNKKMIKILNINDINQTIKIGFTMEIQVNRKPSSVNKNYTLMSIELFDSEIKNIGSYGWSLLCALSFFHNYNNKNSYSPYGYANPSEETLAKILHMGITTVKKYLKVLENHKLIKTQNISPEYISVDGDSGIFQTYNNHYIVYNRIPGHKYYLNSFNKLINYNNKS